MYVFVSHKIFGKNFCKIMHMKISEHKVQQKVDSIAALSSNFFNHHIKMFELIINKTKL